MVQNGSFFYPKKVGFRPTAVYTAVLGDRDMKKYTQEPGGYQTLCLGAFVSTSCLPPVNATVGRAP